jgi:hypothetical protein
MILIIVYQNQLSSIAACATTSTCKSPQQHHARFSRERYRACCANVEASFMHCLSHTWSAHGRKSFGLETMTSCNDARGFRGWLNKAVVHFPPLAWRHDESHVLAMRAQVQAHGVNGVAANKVWAHKVRKTASFKGAPTTAQQSHT